MPNGRRVDVILPVLLFVHIMLLRMKYSVCVYFLLA